MKTPIHFLTILIIFLFSTRLFSQTNNKILRLKPDSLEGKDAVLGSLFPDKNYGLFPEFTATAWTNNSINVVDRSLIQFNFNALPKNSTIVTAKLSLFNNPNSATNNGEHSTLGGSNACYLQRIISPWDEDSVTANNQPATTTQNQVTLKVSDSTHEDYLNIDVTQLVIDMMIDSANNYGFMLQLITEDPFRCLLFASSDHADSSKHPMLVIEYKTPNTGISQIFNNNLDINIYPNPSIGSVYITGSIDYYQTMKVEVIDAYGRILLTQQINFNANPVELNFSNYPLLNRNCLNFIKILSKDFEITKSLQMLKP